MNKIFDVTADKMQETMSTFTLNEIYQQPATWKKTCAQIKEHKDELKKFIDQVITCEDFDVILTGAGTSEFVGNALFPALTEEEIGSWTTVIMIFLGAFFTALGVYDRLGRVAGGGSIIPITGFANSVVSPALEFNREGVFFGVCAKMFVIAGPIIVFGVVSGVVVGVIHLFV